MGLIKSVSSVHVFVRVCESVHQGFVVVVVASPGLISLFVCLVGPCWWMSEEFGWSVLGGEERRREERRGEERREKKDERFGGREESRGS